MAKKKKRSTFQKITMIFVWIMILSTLFGVILGSFVSLTGA